MINFDETQISSSCERSYSWASKQEGSSRLIGKDMKSLSLMTAISSEGDIWFQFLKGNNNEGSVSAFLLQLSRMLDEAKPQWRSSHILLLDNCPSHKTSNVTKLLNTLKVPTLFSAPASFLVAPVERFFGALKSVDYEQMSVPDILKISRPSAKSFTHT